MSSADRLPTADLPDSPHARQLRAGFPWLTFHPGLETEFRCAHFDENLVHTRVNICLAVVITIAFSAMESTVLGAELNRIPSMIHMLVIIPILLIGLASSFSAQRHRIYPPFAVAATTILGLGVGAIQIIATLGGTSILFPCLMLTIIFIYFMAGLIFYHAVAANALVMFAYLGAGTALQMPGREFAYDALAMVAANVFGASGSKRCARRNAWRCSSPISTVSRTTTIATDIRRATNACAPWPSRSVSVREDPWISWRVMAARSSRWCCTKRAANTWPRC